MLANLSQETFSRNLKLGHEIGTFLWSRWTRKWRRCSVEFYGFKTLESISEVCMMNTLGHGLASTHLWRKQQDEVPVLLEFQTFPFEYSCHQGHTGGILMASIWVDGSRSCSTQKRIPAKPRKVHHHTKLKNTLDAENKVNLTRAQDNGLRFWQTVSEAVIVYSFVLAGCIFKVCSQKGERTLFERLSMPRPSPCWSQQQQQQRDTAESASSSTRKLVQRVRREQTEDQCNLTVNAESSRSRKLERRAGSAVEKDPEFKVHLRIEEIAQDLILKDEVWSGKIQEAVERRRNGSRTKSILEDLGKPQNSLIFRKESSRIHEMCDMELYDLGQMTRTVQCHSCWKHLPEGLAFCSCGVCLRLDWATIQKDLSKSYCVARINPIKEQEAWRNSVATRSFESSGCQKRSEETWQGHYHNQVATGWEVQEFSAFRWMDGRILPILGLPHDDRHLSHRTLASEAPVRKHHCVGMQRWGSPSWTKESKNRFQTHCENSRKTPTRTRTTESLHPEEQENEAKIILWSTAIRIRVDESKLEDVFLAPFFLFIIFTNILVATRKSRLLIVWTPRHPLARSQVVKKSEDPFQNRCGSHFARFLRIRSFYKDFRVQEIAIPLSATGGVDRTNSRTHIFLCLVASCMSEHILPSDAHASGSRCSQELCCPSLRTQKIISYHSMFHRTLLGVLYTCSSFCSSPPKTTPT